MCDERLFAPQIAALEADYNIFVPQLSGARSIEGLAKIVLDQTPERFALVGLSMGGIVAMEIVRQQPDRVTHLVLMDTTPLADAPERAPVRQAQIRKVRAGGLREVMRDEMKPNYLADGPNRAEILDLCMDMAEGLGARVFELQSIALLERQDQQETLSSVSVPTLIICGSDDSLCPIDRHELISDLIQSSRLEIIDGAGHLPTLERAEHVTKLIKDWFGPIV